MKILTNIEYLGSDIYKDVSTYKISYIEVNHLSPDKIARAMNFERERTVYGGSVSDVLRMNGIDLVFNSTIDSIIDSGG